MPHEQAMIPDVFERGLEELARQSPWTRDRRLGDHCDVHLARLLLATGSPPADHGQAFAVLSSEWRDRSLERRNNLARLTMDDTPLEVSVITTAREHRVRWVVEPFLHKFSGEQAWTRLRGLCERLKTHWPIDDSQLLKLEAAIRTQPKIGVLMGADDVAGGRAFKLYLCVPSLVTPQPSFVTSALQALGLHKASTLVCDWITADERFWGVALDLVPGGRTKVYMRHLGNVAARVEQIGRLTSGVPPGELEKFLLQVCGRMEKVRPMSTLHFRAGDERPRSVTCSLVWNQELLCRDGPAISDGALRDRLIPVYERYGLSSEKYCAALDAYARVTLEREHLIHSAFALQWLEGTPALTAYLNPRAFVYMSRAS